MGPACTVSGYPNREVVTQCRDRHLSKVQKVATGAITGAGAQQGMVPKWYQVSVSTSGQLLKASQVGGLCSSEIWLHAIASHLLYAKG